MKPLIKNLARTEIILTSIYRVIYFIFIICNILNLKFQVDPVVNKSGTLESSFTKKKKEKKKGKLKKEKLFVVIYISTQE